MDAGVLSFPLTPFDEAGAIDLAAYRVHLESQIAAGPGALFVCCGTGEFFSLSEQEYQRLVTVAVEVAAGRLPVVAGIGYGWAIASRFAAAAERAGVDGALLLPPYLVESSADGFVQHVRRIAEASTLPLIVYQRGQVKLTADSVGELARIPTVIGVKDGHCDLDQLQRLRLMAPDEWLFFNGAPTAEMQAAAYRGIGVSAYSSAVHAYAPEIAGAFFRAFHQGETALVQRLLREFYLPLVELRDRGTGYAVSLVKAGARLRGARVGSVRAPLTDPPPEHLEQLRSLLDTGLALAGTAP